MNLHHFLYVTARARAGLDASRPAVLSALADTAGFGALSIDDQRAWEAALDYYRRSIARRDVLFDSALVAVNDRLAELEVASTLRGAGLEPGLVAALDGAAPVYRKLWWPRHDASNRRWAAGVRTLLARHGDSVAVEESRIFKTAWSTTAVHVDVAAYTNWAGAYTTEWPSHINVSSTAAGNQGTAAFETLFHEVLHTMDATLFDTLRVAFGTAGKRQFRDPTHPFVFYTAGELTRRRFPGYVPFAEQLGIWTRSPDFARMLPLLRTHWQTHMDARASLTQALTQIAADW